MSFECLRDKRANLFFAGLAIPDVSNIDTECVRYLPSGGKIIVVGLVRREFRQWSRVPTSRTLTDIGEFTVLVISDVSGIHTECVRYA